MTFTLDTWKEKAAQRLRHVGDWLQRKRTEDAPLLLYGGLCGMSLWPLVQAAQAGQWLPVVMALGSVAGGVGGNLIAEQVQRWKDQADVAPADETQVAEWVAGQAPADADLREALDTILERLDAVAQAQSGLSQADRPLFAATLREELSQLGNLARFQAALDNIMIAGDVHGDVVSGQKTTVFDQRRQQAGKQINVAGDWTGGRMPGLDENEDE